MYGPSRDQARALFFETWRRWRDGLPLEGMQAVALEAILAHPEYHGVLSDPARHLERDYPPEAGETNPFLHLALHVALAEQLATDQPPGIRAAFDALLARRRERHAAEHAAIDCLAEMVWRAQRAATAPDAAAYLECLRRAATAR